MHSSIIKLGLNLSPVHIRVLGVRQYAQMLSRSLLNAGTILRSRGLLSLDRAMGSSPVELKFKGRRFFMDCPATDACIRDGTYTFGILREMFLRNCYVRGGIEDALDNARYVLDLGANRGAFSVMAATTAKLVVAVEVLPEFVEAIRINADANQMDNIQVEIAFIGSGGEYTGPEQRHTSIEDLLEKYQISAFDVIKIDIEGSEFTLFANPTWLERCQAVCMEVHPEFGRVADILEAFEHHGFTYQASDHMFRTATDPQTTEFIHAWKPNGK